jgi:hypothetical protein
MFNRKSLVVCMAVLVGSAESNDSLSQSTEPNQSGDVADSYFEQAQDSDSEIIPSQYGIDGQRMTPLSVCGRNGANVSSAMEAFERDEPNFRPKSDASLRIIQNGIGSFTGLQPGSDLFEARNESMNRAMLNAKANIIKTIYQKITAEQVVKIPISGLSIDEKIDLQGQSLRSELSQLTAETEVLGAEYAGLTEAVLTSSSADNLQGLTTVDRVNSFFDAAIKQLDESYDPANAGAEKKAIFENLKSQLTQKRAAFISNVNKLADLQRDLTNIQNQTIAETSVQSLSSMPLYGASTIKHLECYDAEERSIYTMVKLIWTPGLHEQARAILLNETVDLPPGEKSFEDFIYDLDISQLLGSYRYIDDSGTPWFYAIRSADYTIGNPATIQDRTNLLAAGQAVLALYAEVKTSSNAKVAVANAESSRTSVTAQQFSQEQSQKANDLNIFGLSTARSTIVISPITNREEYISVAAINMKDAHNAPGAMAELYATLREVNSDQSYREGLLRGMADEANSTKNDPAARAAGYSDGSDNVVEVTQERKLASEPLAPADTGTMVDPSLPSAPVENSSTFSSQPVIDDF